MNIAAILLRKDATVEWISQHASLREAARRMQAKSVSALLVEADGLVASLITDHDIAAAVALHGGEAAGMPLSQIAATPAIWLTPGDSVATAMLLMTDSHVRHLLVGTRWDVQGIVSIGDLVGFLLDDGEADSFGLGETVLPMALN